MKNIINDKIFSFKKINQLILTQNIYYKLLYMLQNT